MVEIIYRTAAGEARSITFDATEREQHRGKASTTKRRVEQSMPVTDHVIADPHTLRLEAFVSNTPIRTPKTLADGAKGEVSQRTIQVRKKPPWRGAKWRRTGVSVGVSGSSVNADAQGDIEPINENLPDERFVEEDLGVRVLQFDTEFDRVRRVHDKLNELRKEGRVVRVITSLQEYDNMVITNVESPRSAQNGDAITFGLELEQIRRAKTESTDAPEPAEERGHPLKSRGKQPAQQLEESEAQKHRSWWDQIRRAFTG